MKKKPNITEELSFSILDSLTANICILDHSGEIIAVNKAWCDFSDANPPAINNYGLGNNYLDICDLASGEFSEGAKEFATGIRSVADGSLNSFVLEYPCSSPQEERWFVGRVSKLLGSVPPMIIIAHENITDRKKADDLVKRYAEKLKESNSGKDRLISFISHDLKNTFHGLLGLSDVLENNIDSLNKNEINQIAGELNKTLKAQYKQLENLLTWAKMQLGQIGLNSDSFNLKDLANSNLEILKNFYIKKEINVINKIESIWVTIDSTLLNSIFQNLILNAIKFTNVYGTITLYSQVGVDFIEVMVEDTGVGISEENLKKLFDSSIHFSIAGTNGEMGSGLGLLICKEMVERLGGSLSVISKYGQGSTFVFSIPASKINHR